MTRRLYAGVDIGGTKLLAALVDDRGDVLARAKAPTPADGPSRIVKTVVRLVEDACGEAGASPRELRAAGVGAPGVIDPSGKEILAAPNVDLAGYPLARRLEEKIGARVVLGNDVNLGVLGEQWLGAARGARNVVGLFPGTGVGGGIVVEGRLVVGAHGAAAELGHVLVDPQGPLCGCRNRGCLEAIASRTAIEREIRRDLREGKRSVVEKKARGGRIKSKALAKALRKGDPVVTRAVRRAAEALGAACVSLRHVFDPELFVLGGGVIEACGDFVLPIVRRMVARDPFFSRVGSCRVARSTLGDDAVVLGAVALARLE